VEARVGNEGKRPQLSDLRESGAIEQDADMVCFIHRPEYYKIYTDEKGNDLTGKAEIIVAKHRNGATGDILLTFKNEYAKFQNIDDEQLVQDFRSRMNSQEALMPPPPANEGFLQKNNGETPF
jgi:replicative DNA helicase